MHLTVAMEGVNDRTLAQQARQADLKGQTVDTAQAAARNFRHCHAVRVRTEQRSVQADLAEFVDQHRPALVRRLVEAIQLLDLLQALGVHPLRTAVGHAAALARPAADPREAERFELYACGVELANGFGELTDPAEQRRRFTAEMDERARVYGERYPLDEDFLAALAQMPDASGIALGFDRLVMLATGAARIDDVQWTPVP